MRADSVWKNLNLVMPSPGGVEVIDGAMVAEKNGAIIFAGPAGDAPDLQSNIWHDGGQRLATPGLIDCHTHLVYAGTRAAEFAMRLQGRSYSDIAKAGGGIWSTVSATRAASDAALLEESLARLRRMQRCGVTTVEIKSGYGLDLASEQRMLRIARQLGPITGMRVHCSFLGAHAVPPEYAGNADAYVTEVCAMIAPLAAAGLIDSVDAFCEGIAFSSAQVERVFRAASAAGLPVRLHAEQLSNLGGAAMAARMGALSADHLEYLDDDGIAAMKAAGTVAVMLPGAYYFTRETRLPPIAELRRAGVPLAVATDCNPGTSPMTSLPLAMNMAATLFGMTVDECLTGVTCHAARALGMAGQIGGFNVGAACDIALWTVGDPAELVYPIGDIAADVVVIGGQIMPWPK